MHVGFTVTESHDGIIVAIRKQGNIIGARFEPLTKKNIMDLLATQKKIKEQSIKDKDKTLFIDIDTQGECSIASSFTKDQSMAAYRNGGEIPLPEPKPSKTEADLGKVAVETVEKINRKTKTTSGDAKPKTKMEKVKKTAPKKGAKKTAKKVTAKKVTAKKILKPKGALPEGKKMTITIKKAIELAKKGAAVYRASNGSPFGLFYLEKQANKDREMELIVRQ